jgi:translation elongation factor EF-1alpha
MQKHFFFYAKHFFHDNFIKKHFFLKFYMTIKQIITVQNKIDNFIQKNILIFLM